MSRLPLPLLLAACSLLLSVTAVLAAEPDLIGGTLTAGGHEAIVTSDATIPVSVRLSGEVVKADPETFALAPGDSRHVTLTGESIGHLSATLTSLASGGMDSASVTLSVNLSEVPLPPDYRGVLTALLAAAGVLMLLWRIRPWQYRLSRRTTD